MKGIILTIVDVWLRRGHWKSLKIKKKYKKNVLVVIISDCYTISGEVQDPFY